MCGLCSSVNTARFFMVHSSDQYKVRCPLDIIACRREAISKAFPRHFGLWQAKFEAREGLGTRLCILFASYQACCQDCHLTLSQTPTVVPIPGNLLLFIIRVFGHCIALDSQADQDLDQQRQSAGSSAKICAPLLAFSRVKGRSAAELEEARVECAGCLCTLGCKSGCSTTRKRASNPGSK